MRNRERLTLLIATVLLALGGARVDAATFTVTNLNSSGAGSLRQAVTDSNTAAGADTIAFQSGLTGTIVLNAPPSGGELPISGDLTILGPSPNVLTVSGGGATRVFSIASGATVRISRLAIARGSSFTPFSDPGGGGAFENRGSLTLTLCILSNNAASFVGTQAGGLGGAIDNYGPLTLSDCTLSDNNARTGGSIFNRSGATATLTRCTLSHNVAGVLTRQSGDPGGPGGAIENSGGLTLSDCTLSDNSAQAGGGAVNNQPGGIATLSRCTLTHNAAASPGFQIDDMGGAINNHGNLSVTNSVLSENSAELGGGAINNQPGGGLTLTGCAFSTNSVASPDIFFRGGGAVNNEGGTVTAESCSFSENAGKDRGGAVANHGASGPDEETQPVGSITLADCIFSGNHTVMGGAVFNVGKMTLIRCDLTGNRAVASGGAIFNDVGGMQVLNCTISNNLCESEFGHGGGIINGGSMTLGSCLLSGNQTGNRGEGGGILNKRLSSTAAFMQMGSCRLSSNSAGEGGGLKNEQKAVLTLCDLFANFAASNGGGIHHDGGEMFLRDSTVAGNGAGGAPGDGFGGGIFCRAELTVLRCTINNNIAQSGGGIHNRLSGEGDLHAVTMDNSTLSANRALRGGGFFNDADTQALNCTVSGNRSEEGEGGGLRNGERGVFKLGNCLVANSAAGKNGFSEPGGVFVTLGHNLDSDGSLALTDPSDRHGTADTPLDPKLGPLQNNGGPTQTHALSLRSPAIDRGSPALAPDSFTDQRGFTRFADGNGDGFRVNDIGAYELTFLGPIGPVFPGRPPTRGRLLAFSTVKEQFTPLPAGTSEFNLTIHYDPNILPRSLTATINGKDITRFFHPGTADGFETVRIPLRPGENRLILRATGTSKGRPAEEVTELGFRVGEPPLGRGRGSR